MAIAANNLRNAAILVATLDGPVAEQILVRLAPRQADQVRRAATNLGPISQSERDAALRQFDAATVATPRAGSTNNVSQGQETPPTANPLPEDGGGGSGIDINPSSGATDLQSEDGGGGFQVGPKTGVELQGSLARLLDEYDSRASSYSGRVPPAGFPDDADGNIGDLSSDNRATFGFLEQTEPSTLAAVLRKEHPQTAAVVLSRVAADRAAELLTYLPEPLQLDVLRRMSELEPSDPESVRVLEGELRTWVEDHRQNERRRERGIATVRNILAATAAKDRTHLVRRIRECDGTLASRLGNEFGCDGKKRDRSAGAVEQLGQLSGSVALETTVSTRGPAHQRPATSPSASESLFSQRPAQSQTVDLAHLSDTVWTRLLPSVEPQLLVLALTGEEQVLIDRVASHLTTEDAQILQQSLKSLGPIRLSDVVAARDELVRMAAQFTNPPPALPIAA